MTPSLRANAEESQYDEAVALINRADSLLTSVGLSAAERDSVIAEKAYCYAVAAIDRGL